MEVAVPYLMQKDDSENMGETRRHWMETVTTDFRERRLPKEA